MKWLYGLVLLILTTSSAEASLNDILNAFLAPIRGIQKVARFFDVSKSLTSDVIYEGKEPRFRQYDFIVVGMSPSGCVIANRLSEDPKTTVLLLEAGQEDNVITDIPALNPYTLFTDYNWRFPTEHAYGVCLGMTDEICPWPAGKGPGGGTILNGMIWTRGFKRDYDGWAAEGNPGWSYNEIRHLFNRMETMTIKELRNSKYHGTNGYITISYVPFVTPLFEAFVKAGEFFGFRRIDYNNPNTPIGFSQIQSTTMLGERVTAAKAYINPFLDRPNLHISMRSRVAKVLIDPNFNRAYGVKYIKNDQAYVVYAGKEVILSAGAFNSPQLLMLSGIGHADHLKEFDIPLIQDLPVGDNLMEHPGMHGLTFLVNQNVSISPLITFRNAIPNGLDYFVKSRGILTTLGCEGIAFMKTKYANVSDNHPDIELLFVGSAFNEDAGFLLRKSFGVSDELYEYTYRAVDGKPAFSIWPLILYPESRGYVRLRDKSPLSKVRIYHNLFTDRKDILIVVEGIKLAIALTRTPPYRQFGVRLWDKPFPTCVDYKFGTDDYWECAVRTMPTQFHHQSGTCKMGSVVNHRLRVFGTIGLRVADASIMPRIIGGHTQAPAYLIGEKAAEMIKEDWLLPKRYYVKG